MTPGKSTSTICISSVGGLFLLASFTHVFALHDYVRAWQIFLFIGLLGSCLSWAYTRRSSARDLVVPRVLFIAIALLIWVTLAGLYSPNTATAPTLAAYYFVFLVVLGGTYLLAARVPLSYVMWANFFGVLLSVIFVHVEVWSNILIGWDIQEWIPRRGRDVLAIYSELGIRRAFGPAGEPGALAFYFNTLGLVGTAFFLRSSTAGSFLKIGYVALFSVAYLLTFSAGGIGSLIAGVLVGGTLLILIGRWRKSWGVPKWVMFALFPAALVIMVVGSRLGGVLDKLLFRDVRMGSGRLERWTEVVQVIAGNPILGNGPGWYSAKGETTAVNWYLHLAAESGIPAVVLVLALFGTVLLVVLRSRVRERAILAIALIAGYVNLSTQSGFFHPFLWLTIVVALLAVKEEGLRSRFSTSTADRGLGYSPGFTSYANRY